MKKLPLKVKIARAFCRILHTWLTPCQMQQVVLRNRTRPEGVCHSHDFCDPNVAMDDAFKKVRGRRMNAQRDSDLNLWIAAWDLAIKAEFNPKKIT